MKEKLPSLHKISHMPMNTYCPADPRLGYFTFGVHEKIAKECIKIFSQDESVDYVEYVEGNIRIYYKEINNA
tara:strand:+ start:3809 stop:4024 length:216 start_codon:yes stop_codon:yes gene_type:complete